MMNAQLYGLSLAGVGAWLLLADDERDLRTAVALLLNWLAAVVAIELSGSAAPWGWFIVIDGLTAWVVTRQPAGKAQAIIGTLLVNQIMAHMLFGWEANPAGQEFYLRYLNLAGWAQVATLFWGATHDSGRKILGHWRRPGADLVADPPGGGGLEKRRGP